MRILKTILPVVTLGALLCGLSLPAGAEDAKPMLIGAEKCKICHKKNGDQWGIWEASKHAQAFTILASDAAKEVATAKGIADPQKAPECLKCHTTHAFLGSDVPLDPKGKYADTEGVGCETCHGPGSEYKSMSVMKDREQAIAAGLLLQGEEHCVKCHNEESPTYKPFTFEERWAVIAHPVTTEE
jgi:hypothetical protein